MHQSVCCCNRSRAAQLAGSTCVHCFTDEGAVTRPVHLLHERPAAAEAGRIFCITIHHRRMMRCIEQKTSRLCTKHRWKSTTFYVVYYVPAPRAGGIKRWCASDVWRLSVCRVHRPKSRIERPRKTKIGAEVAHVTRDSDTTFKIKRSKVNLQRRGYIMAASHTACLSYINIQRQRFHQLSKTLAMVISGALCYTSRPRLFATDFVVKSQLV